MFSTSRKLGSAARMPSSFASPTASVTSGRRATVPQSEFQRLFLEQLEQRDCDGTHLIDGEMRDRCLRHLRQQHGNAVAARDAMRPQHIGQPIALGLQPIEADPVEPAIGMQMQQRQTAAAIRPAVAAIDRPCCSDPECASWKASRIAS